MSASTCAITVPLNLIAWGLWGLAFMLIAADWFVANTALWATVVLLALGGATIHVRGFIAAQEQRERAAFELGRDTVRSLR